jgi:putative oxidoreductase
MKPGPSRWVDWAPLPLRLILGIGFLYHGIPKVFTAEGHQQFLGMLQNVGVPLPEVASWAVGLVEVVGGLCFLAGAFVALFAALNIANMLVAMFAVHLPHGFNFINITGMTEQGPQFGMPGFEVNLLYIAALVALLIGGTGKLSLDKPIRRAIGIR